MSCSADAAKTPPPVTPTTEEQKTLYALGVLMSQSLGTFELKPEEFAMVQKGLADGVGGVKPVVNPEEYIPKVQALQQARMAVRRRSATARPARNSSRRRRRKPASPRPRAASSSSTRSPAPAPRRKPTDQVKVHYEGRLIDGTVFDSSKQHGGQPAEFPLNGVIACWTEGVQTMKVGGKAQLVCPANLAYGERGSPPKILPGSTLVFDVELLDIVKKQ